MPRSVQSREKDFHPVQKPKMDQHDHRSRQRHWEEQPGGRSPDNKRRRVSHTSFRPTLHPSYRERSPGNVAPESPHPMTPWSARPDVPQRHLPMLQPQRPYQVAPSQSHPDPSLKLPPLQTATPPAMTPMTPYPQEGSSVEATVMTIPFLNKIKVLAKISPPLLPSFRDGVPPPRGPVIAIDGQDPDLVQAVVEYLDSLLKKETKYHVRVFDGPEIKPPRPTSSEGQMGDATVDYLNTISAWHRISDEVIGFVKSISRAGSVDARSTTDEEIPPNVSPRTLIPKAAALHIHSPAQSSENGSETSAITTASHCAVPIALVPRYQLTTADAFACSTPIGDSYAPLDHWQWMASLWRACVGPDITVYIRECSKEELDRVGAVEVRLQDARTVVLRKVIGRDLEEKALKRMGFEIEDFLTQ